jgi:3-deoxy-7-phosphoheptulonate synthase
VTKGGHSAIVSTTGNVDCHVILRGGKTPNYSAESIAAACAEAAKARSACRIMVDASHGNSSKDPANQRLVIDDVAGQIADGERRVFGLMIESNLVAGKQALVAGEALTYGQSITDGCIGWDDSVELMDRLANAVEQRRAISASAAA